MAVIDPHGDCDYNNDNDAHDDDVAVVGVNVKDASGETAVSEADGSEAKGGSLRRNAVVGINVEEASDETPVSEADGSEADRRRG